MLAFFTCPLYCFRFLKIYKKFDKFVKIVKHFSTREWTFNNSNLKDLWTRQSQYDQLLFPFNVSVLNWDVFLQNQVVLGIRSCVLKEDISTVPAALEKYKRFVQNILALALESKIHITYFILHILHRTLQAILLGLLFYLLNSLVLQPFIHMLK